MGACTPKAKQYRWMKKWQHTTYDISLAEQSSVKDGQKKDEKDKHINY